MRRFREIHRENTDAARNLRQRQTAAEKRLWEFLRYRQVGGARVRRQYAIGRFVLDFYVPAVRLAIEIDGSIHNDEFIAAQDLIRTDWLKSRGIQVVRFRNEEIWEDIGAVLTKIEQVICESK